MSDTPLPCDAYDVLRGLAHARYSCRSFRPDPLPRETIERILALAQRTASWCNAQPWTVHLVGGDRLEALRAAMQQAAAEGREEPPDIAWPREYRGVYQQRRRECGFGLYEAVGVARGDRVASARQAAENFRMFGAPHVAIISSDEALGVYGTVDCGAYVSQFLLAAQSLGVATIAQAALATWPSLLREHLGIGADRTIVCGISFGWADEAHPANHFRTTRAAVTDSVVWCE